MIARDLEDYLEEPAKERGERLYRNWCMVYDQSEVKKRKDKYIIIYNAHSLPD